MNLRRELRFQALGNKGQESNNKAFGEVGHGQTFKAAKLESSRLGYEVIEAKSRAAALDVLERIRTADTSRSNPVGFALAATFLRPLRSTWLRGFNRPETIFVIRGPAGVARAVEPISTAGQGAARSRRSSGQAVSQ